MKKSKNKSYPSGIMLYAKDSGPTSFGALWSIKNALGTEKVGHTGTLDAFAEGLLVILTGSLTHLVPHITGFSKTYQAVICFGKTTETLDPSGKIIKTGSVPSRSQVEDVLDSFKGPLLQVPPVYSSVHVQGKRASSLARDGKAVKLESRQIVVYDIKLLDYAEPYALIEVSCSKGTYIRALARDIAEKLGTVAFLSALRRTRVGPFKLEDAALYSKLKPFTIENAILNERNFSSGAQTALKGQGKDSASEINEIKSRFLSFTPELAFSLGFSVDSLKEEYEKSYLNGRPLSGKMFNRIPNPQLSNMEYAKQDEIAVFYSDQSFAGIININEDRRLSYGFVVPHRPAEKMKVFSWQEFTGGAFPVEWKNKGTALSVGSFDGVHAGHSEILSKVLDQKTMCRGVVTFRKSAKNGSNDFGGELQTLSQKLSVFEEKGFDFTVVIDFSEDFSKIDGDTFISMLVSSCSLKFLSEGKDFTCGYRGSVGIKELNALSEKYLFTFCPVEDVMYQDKKISSSRIRECVKKADFSSAMKMLLRPYSLDLTGFNFTEKSDSWFEFKTGVLQVLPKDGSYEVVVIMPEQVLHTTLVLECGIIKLLLPTENFARQVRAINFIPSV